MTIPPWVGILGGSILVLISLNWITNECSNYPDMGPYDACKHLSGDEMVECLNEEYEERDE